MGEASDQAVAVSRTFIEPESARWPEFVDMVVMSARLDHLLLSLYQTAPPPPGDAASVDSRLVGRFVFAEGHYREFVAVVLRQLVRQADLRGRREEAVSWLKEQLSELDTPATER